LPPASQEKKGKKPPSAKGVPRKRKTAARAKQGNASSSQGEGEGTIRQKKEGGGPGEVKNDRGEAKSET